MEKESKKRVLVEVTLREPGTDYDNHVKYYVSRMDPSTIKELREVPNKVISYRFSVCNTDYYPETGNEETKDYIYTGQRVYYGEVLDVREAAFVFGTQYDRILGSGYRDRDGIKVGDIFVSDDRRQIVQRFCISGQGENQVISPMHVTDATHDEYISFLRRFYKVVDSYEQGVDRDCDSKTKVKE